MTEPAPRDALTHGAVTGLPRAYRWLIPELAGIPWPEETRADCGDCVMVPPPGQAPGEGERVFHSEVRCCSYHPSLPNHRVGRILNAGGSAAELVAARLRRPSGVSMHGVDPWRSHSRRHAWGATAGFGRELSLRCPYWVGGDLACGIWQHREATCRTFFCRHVEGLRGAALWRALREAMAWVDNRLATWLVSCGDPPRRGAGAARFEAWYRWCDETLEATSREAITALAGDTLARLRVALREANLGRIAPWPTALEPEVAEMTARPDGVLLYGAATYDPIVVPSAIHDFFARLDGVRHWEEALAECARETREVIGADLVGELLRRGILHGASLA